MTSSDGGGPAAGDGPPLVEGTGAVRERLSGANGLLLGLDFDGTLAPIVNDPDAASADPAVIGPLEVLVAREGVRVAVVSGRALADLADRVPVEDVDLAGNHGLERRRDGERAVVPAARDARDRLETLRNDLDAAIGDVPGCRIEDKGLSLSVHVRETPEQAVPTVREAVMDAVENTADLRLVSGKAVYEIRRAVDHDKGTAMANLAAEIPDGWRVLYVGDDETDEDAFEAIQPDGVGIHVGTGGETAAVGRLQNQDAVAPFLEWLSAGDSVGTDDE